MDWIAAISIKCIPASIMKTWLSLSHFISHYNQIRVSISCYILHYNHLKTKIRHSTLQQHAFLKKKKIPFPRDLTEWLESICLICNCLVSQVPEHLLQRNPVWRQTGRAAHLQSSLHLEWTAAYDDAVFLFCFVFAFMRASLRLFLV